MNQLFTGECAHDFMNISELCRECSKCGIVQEFGNPWGWVTIPPSNKNEVKASHLVEGMYLTEQEKKQIKKHIKKNL